MQTKHPDFQENPPQTLYANGEHRVVGYGVVEGSEVIGRYRGKIIFSGRVNYIVESHAARGDFGNYIQPVSHRVQLRDVRYSPYC